MDSFSKGGARFTYNPGPNQKSEESFSALLDIHLHHARNIHNICIYENQDVYAKFSLTYDPDETLSTRIVRGGGKNPTFDERLVMKIRQPGAVLKCEIWMLSCAKNFMDDQLLGFALVPVSSVSGKGKVTQDLDLSSTDLFHSPAGTVKLSLSLDAKSPFPSPRVDSCPPTTSELLMDEKISEEYLRIEFPDMNSASENEQMVSEYFERHERAFVKPWPDRPDGSFLRLGSVPIQDHEMGTNQQAGSVSPDGSAQTSGFLGSTVTSLGDDRASADSTEKKGGFFVDFPEENELSAAAPVVLETGQRENGLGLTEGGEIMERKERSNVDRAGLVGDESVMQKQIVDMYMRSMQQFTESLAKMKLPVDLEKPKIDKKIEMEGIEKKESNSRVFYGSRAFF